MDLILQHNRDRERAINSQTWRVICLDNRQVENVDPSDDLKDVFNSRKTKFDAWSKLARPEKIYHVRTTPVTPVTRLQESSLSKLERLSNEILEMIIDHLLPERSDVVAFGLSSERLWLLVRRHIQLSILQNTAPWAGKKLILHGSESRDLPESITEDDIPKILSSDGYGSLTKAKRLFTYGCLPALNNFEDRQLEWAGAVIAHAGRILIPDARWKELERDMRCLEFFPTDQPWLLRNHTAHEIVSSEKLGVKVTAKSPGGSVQGVPTFNHILLMRICWSDAIKGSDAVLNIHRGVWAGHRFDIVTRVFHESEKGWEDWRDVTEEVGAQLAELRAKLARR